MSSRLVMSLAVLAAAAPVHADTPDASVTLGAGEVSTRGTLGSDRLLSLSLSGSWFPVDGWPAGRLGGRVLLGVARADGGTTLVNSDRISGTVSALASGRLHLGGPFYAVGGAGPGAVVVRTSHTVVTDERTVFTARPALAWSAGVELVYEQLVVRAEHVGAWSSLSRDLGYAISLGTVF